MDNGTNKYQGNNEYAATSSAPATASATATAPSDYSSQQGNQSTSQSYPQHQISTTVTTNRPAMGTYGPSSTSSTSNPSTGPQSASNSYKMKQQRSYGNNRYEPMSAQGAGYQARNAQMQGQWNNGAATGNQYGSLGNPFGLPHHYQQQQTDMYAGYYGPPPTQPTPSSYGLPGAQQQAGTFNDYGQQQNQYGSAIPPESPKGGHVVYVYGIGQRATQEELFALFQQFGRVLRVDIIIDFNTGLCKGYAFVAMEQYHDAQMAVQNLNAAPFHGRQLQVRFKT